MVSIGRECRKTGTSLLMLEIVGLGVMAESVRVGADSGGLSWRSPLHERLVYAWRWRSSRVIHCVSKKTTMM